MGARYPAASAAREPYISPTSKPLAFRVSPNAYVNSRIAGRKRQCYFTPETQAICRDLKINKHRATAARVDASSMLDSAIGNTPQFALGEDQIAVRDMARSFAAEVFAPHAVAWDEAKHFP